MPLIHQIVLGTNVPPINRQCLDSWRPLERRGFTIVSWTSRSAEDYLANCPVEEARTLYKRARNLGEASDILRMVITYAHGGLYVDWDVLLLDPDKFLDVMPDLERSNCVLLRDPHTTAPDFACTYDNSLFYLRQGNTLALDFLRDIEQNYSTAHVRDTPFVTGPLALTRFLESRPDHRNDCRLVDTLDVYSFDYEAVIECTKTDSTREILKDHPRPSGAPAIHFWTHAWVPQRKWSRRLADRISRSFRMVIRAR